MVNDTHTQTPMHTYINTNDTQFQLPSGFICTHTSTPSSSSLSRLCSNYLAANFAPRRPISCQLVFVPPQQYVRALSSAAIWHIIAEHFYPIFLCQVARTLNINPSSRWEKQRNALRIQQVYEVVIKSTSVYVVCWQRNMFFFPFCCSCFHLVCRRLPVIVECHYSWTMHSIFNCSRWLSIAKMYNQCKLIMSPVIWVWIRMRRFHLLWDFFIFSVH